MEANQRARTGVRFGDVLSQVVEARLLFSVWQPNGLSMGKERRKSGRVFDPHSQCPGCSRKASAGSPWSGSEQWFFEGALAGIFKKRRIGC